MITERGKYQRFCAALSRWIRAVIGMAVCSSHIVVAAQPFSLAQYDAKLAQIQSALTIAASGNTRAAVQALRIADTIGRCNVLETLPDARLTLVSPDNRPLIAQIVAARASGGPLGYRNAADSIASIRAAMPLHSVPTKLLDPQRSIISVLSAQAFASDPVPAESGWDKFWDWVYDELKKIRFPHASHASFPSISPVIPEVLLLIVLTAAVALLGYIVYQIWRNRSIRGALQTMADSGLALDAAERELVAGHNYARLRQLASEASAQGRYRDAFRLIFLALLVLLDAEGAIKLNRSRTNWEYLRTLVDREPLAAQLRPLVRDFDRIWYGEEQATEDDFMRADAVYDDVHRSVTGVALGQLPTLAGKPTPTEAR